jgi:starch phosphorylase
MNTVSSVPQKEQKVSSTGEAWLYRGTIPCRSSGQHGYTVRVLPRHPDLANLFEPGLVCWS